MVISGALRDRNIQAGPTGVARDGIAAIKLPPAKRKSKTPAARWSSGRLVLATSYSRTTYRRTTIGAAAFHFRVRNGNGWDHCAMITRGPSRTGISLLWAARKREAASLETTLTIQRTRFQTPQTSTI